MSGTGMNLRPVELLLVEDSKSDIIIFTETLRELPFPINVQVATDGERALQSCSGNNFHPDLVILDLNIPKVHGLDVLKRCRSQENELLSSVPNRIPRTCGV